MIAWTECLELAILVLVQVFAAGVLVAEAHTQLESKQAGGLKPPG